MAGPHPPATLRIELERARADGVSFRVAWSRAMYTALAGAREKGQWRVALRSTKQFWLAAYYGWPPPGPDIGELLD